MIDANTILIVDDQEINRVILAELFRDYKTLEAADGDQALQIINEQAPQIVAILLDIVMPKKDGYQVLQKMKELNLLSKIPVLLISSELNTDRELKGYDYGVADILQKPFEAQIVLKRVQNLIEFYRNKNHLEELVALQTQKLQEQNRILERQAHDLKIKADNLKQNNDKLIDIMSDVVECRDIESGEHIKRIKLFTSIFARTLKKLYPEYGLTDEKIALITQASEPYPI